MIKPIPQPFMLPVQQSGSNVFVNLPVEIRGMFGIEKGDVLVAIADPLSDTPLVIAEIRKAANNGMKQTRKGGRKKLS